MYVCTYRDVRWHMYIEIEQILVYEAFDKRNIIKFEVVGIVGVPCADERDPLSKEEKKKLKKKHIRK